MRTVLALQFGLIGQPQIRLVNERSRLEGALPIFASQPRLGDAKQIFVDDRRELLEGARIAIAPMNEKGGNVAGRPGRFRDGCSQIRHCASLFPAVALHYTGDADGLGIQFMGQNCRPYMRENVAKSITQFSQHDRSENVAPVPINS